MIGFDYAHGSAVALLTLKRPPVNAFTPKVPLRLQQTVDRLTGEARVRVIAITSARPKFFSAGADLSAFEDGHREVGHGVHRAAALAVERKRLVEQFAGADQREGVSGLREKRAPRRRSAEDTQ
ncbi:enoyl-CoA hydratase-related protein [Paraburkholderia dipogonis]